MRVRLGRGVRKREDVFGGICYVPARDDFFAANKEVFPLIASLGTDWKDVSREEEATFLELAKLGICETLNPSVHQQAYSGPSFLGVFPEIPTVSEPLVLNCFSTAHCPLKCIYCHADDLMIDFRPHELDNDLDNVISTASMIPSLVAVITGGDPLTRPERAARLIQRLAGQKSLVLDTSGVGDIENLLPLLIEHNVHVRLSLDSISDTNDKLRPVNPKYVERGSLSRSLVERTLSTCLQAGLNVTIQTVVTSRNENYGELMDLRDWIISRGVRHWVLHVAVRGGMARKLEREARKKRRGGVLPSASVYTILWRIVEDTTKRGLPIDIRCTDTDTSPNSVLLVGSKGDLFTEGYAHDGKVVLYNASEARPDMLAALWPHIDRFGHARRYLNWNPWFFEGRSLNEICFSVPLPPKVNEDTTSKQVVETEAKFFVKDLPALTAALLEMGFSEGAPVLQRDEYFDFADRRLAALDFVIRIRKDRENCFVSLKGPRFFTPEGEYSRIELEFQTIDESFVRQEMRERKLEVTWFFEKRRTRFMSPVRPIIVEIDEIPEVGFFVEFEGSLPEVRSLFSALRKFLGNQERRNYRELFVAHRRSQGMSEIEIRGASFI